MTDFPDIGILVNIEEIDSKGQEKGETEAGYVITSAKGTITKQEFNLTYLFTKAERLTMKTFFNTNLGGSFNWTHPFTSTVHDVFFLKDELKWTWDQGILRYRSTFAVREA